MKHPSRITDLYIELIGKLSIEGLSVWFNEIEAALFDPRVIEQIAAVIRERRAKRAKTYVPEAQR